MQEWVDVGVNKITMQVSNLYFELRNHFEGLKLNAYQDTANVWTIGYGTTHYPNGDAVKQGDTCTEEEAVLYANHDTRNVQTGVDAHFKTATQPEFDAMVDFAYNVGLGGFMGSTALKDAITDTGDIRAAFCMWNKAGGKVSNGLMRRRLAEAYLYLNGVNSPDFCIGELEAWKARQTV